MKSLFFKVFISIIIVSSIFACKNEGSKIQKELSFSIKKYEKKAGVCPDESTQCLVVKLTYPQAEGGQDSVRKKLNEYIDRANLSLLTFDENEPDLSIQMDSAVLELKEEYLDFLDDTDFDAAWFFESEGNITYLDSNFVSFDFAQNTYAGGAHPNYYASKSVFDIKTGNPLNLSDLVKDTFALTEAVEAEFRKIREIPEEQSLEEAGFWFEGNSFFLPVNFGLTEKGLEFLYNPYEVAPYSAGPTSIVISDWRKF